MIRTTLLCAGLLPGAASLLPAQSPTSPAPAPSTLVVAAVRAVAAGDADRQDALWRVAATQDPASPVPAFARAALARFGGRPRAAFALLDSAETLAIRSGQALWRHAVRRERANTSASYGEFIGLDSVARVALQDTAGLPTSELAEARYLRVNMGRRIGVAPTVAVLDSLSALAPRDTSLQIRLTCLRASADRARFVNHVEAAITLAEQAGLPAFGANCALMAGASYADGGQPGVALAWLSRAQRLAEQAHDDITLAATLQWRGYVTNSVGALWSARDTLARALRVATAIENRNLQAWVLMNVAANAASLGDRALAANATMRARSLFAATGDPRGQAGATTQYAQTRLALGDEQGADSVLRALIADATLPRSPNTMVAARYSLADIAARLGDFAAADAQIDSAERIIDTIGENWRSEAQVYRGLVALRAGAVARADSIFTAVRPAYSRGQVLYRHEIDGKLSYTALLRGDTTAAVRTLVASNDELDEFRDRLSASGLRRLSGRSRDDWGGTGGASDHVLAALARSSRWIGTAYTMAERQRSRAMSDVAVADPAQDSASIARARQRVRATALDLRATQAALRPDDALLVYAGGEGNAPTTLLVVTRTRAWARALAPLKAIDRDVVRWLALLESGEPGPAAAAAVARMVLDNALATLPASVKRLTVIPQGVLYRVPFHALPLGRQVLGDRLTIRTAPSVSLALQFAAAPAQITPSVLAFGTGATATPTAVPTPLDFTADRSLRSARSDPLAPLPAAPAEARAAGAWTTASQVLVEDAATEGALKAMASRPFGILHAAAHALTSDQALGANWLILRADDVEDGYVSGGELATLSRGRSLVVLSGCRTTGDFGSRGDAVDGLVAPLLANGVRTVIASHWAVSDRWTERLMTRFYRELARGETVAEALSRAQADLRRAGAPARHWAAFSVIGDGDARVGLPPQRAVARP